ncbi:MAG: hypothetical protein OQJ96_06180 [Flavobacteriales bacterium]|nr:hypothetical protein [Flavobacteriales bacterium]MCW8937666.1 hypothetical protein [Flavobacteriales bacterium]MCW8967572.1 hypothetical protein [Flavobacteriales bacterium]MCW8990154.1 hypothetical protein [Flavobacteriales bacterium]MCW9019872.1 hypothetical protein [Flavobacteriales bacterium]
MEYQNIDNKLNVVSHDKFFETDNIHDLRITYKKLHKNFDEILMSKQNLDYAQKLIFCVNTAMIFGLYKSEVKKEYFDQIYVNEKLKKRLIELDNIINVINTINNKTIFYFNEKKIITFFLYYSSFYLKSKIASELSKTDEGFKAFYENFLSTISKTNRRLKENKKPPRKKEDKFLYVLMQKTKENDSESSKQLSILNLNLPLRNKPFQYKFNKCFSHPHKIAYQPIVFYLKELNQDVLGEAFNETEFYVALYDLLKAISHEKDYFKDDDKIHIKDYYKNNVNNYKSKIARNWFS